MKESDLLLVVARELVGYKPYRLPPLASSDEPSVMDVFRKAYSFSKARMEQRKFDSRVGQSSMSVSDAYDLLLTGLKTHSGRLQRLRRIADGKMEPDDSETKSWREEQGRSLKQLSAQEWADWEITQTESYIDKVEGNIASLNAAMSKAKLPDYVREEHRWVRR